MRHLGYAAAALIVIASPSTPTRAQDVGVPACDAFLRTFSTCMTEKMPPEGRSAMQTAMDQMKTNWRAVAATPEGKAQLEPVCKQTAETMKQQMASLNCPW